MNIVEDQQTDIFTTCVFNNIMELTFIFAPRIFLALPQRNVLNWFTFIDLLILQRHDEYR
jgi:hypothetical protein